MPAETKEERARRLQDDLYVLSALAKAGSDLHKPHEIEFHFVGNEKTNLEAVAQEGKKKGYRVSNIDTRTDEQERNYWFFDLIQSIVPTGKNISSHTEYMTKLAKNHSVLFDGWGCSVVK